MKVNNMRERRVLAVRAFAAAVAVIIAVNCPVAVLANWGLEVGRANAGDVGRLASDWNAYRRERFRIERVTQRTQMVAIERQRQLIGVAAENWGPQQLFEAMQTEWLTKIMGPLQSVALNPAASCAEAQFALSTMMGMKRQQQLLGLEESDEIARIYKATEGMAALRCQDEALDECVATGRFAQILELMVGGGRQAQLLGREEDLESWADDAMKQCAVYELHFVSTTSGGHGPVKLETVRDGKVKIRYQTPPGGLKSAVTGALGDILKGETTGGNNPFFVAVKCTPPPAPVAIEFVCSQGADSTPIKVAINELDLKHREFYVDSEFSNRWEMDTVMTKDRLVGEDKLSFDFEGGMFSLSGLIKAPYNAVSMPFPDWGNTFYMAHKKDSIGGERSGKLLIKGNRRGVTPAIFDFNYADQNQYGDALTKDSTDFELNHKPEPKPFRNNETDPIRQPLRPRPS